MAKATVTVAVLLLLFAVAQARFSLDLEKKPVNEEPETVFPESDSKSGATNNFLLLPTEKSETETEIQTELDTAGLIGFDLEAAATKLTEPETSEGESATMQSSAMEVMEPEESDSGSDADSNSVTVISFRPMNQHFRRLPFPFRRGHRCHHLHQRQHGPLFRAEEGLRVRSRDRSYGNDMILSEEGVKLETVLRNPQRLVPGRLMRFRNGDAMRMHRHRFGRHHEREHEQEYRDNDHEDHEHHEHDHHEHDRHEHEHHEHDRHEHDHHEHDHGNGFMRKIRKFLTNF